MPKFTNTRRTQESAQKVQVAKAARDKLAIHAAERVATRALEMLEKAIESNRIVELAIIDKLDGDQILEREKQQFSFAERIYSDLKETMMALQMAQMGFTMEDESEEWENDMKAM